MQENTQDKSLIPINENSLFYKIKSFFRNLFNKKATIYTSTTVAIKEDVNTGMDNNRNDFIESLKNIENEETKLLKLQRQYHSGEITEDDLTLEQIKALCDLYKKQIDSLEKTLMNYTRETSKT